MEAAVGVLHSLKVLFEARLKCFQGVPCLFLSEAPSAGRHAVDFGPGPVILYDLESRDVSLEDSWHHFKLFTDVYTILSFRISHELRLVECLELCKFLASLTWCTRIGFRCFRDRGAWGRKSWLERAGRKKRWRIWTTRTRAWDVHNPWFDY